MTIAQQYIITNKQNHNNQEIYKAKDKYNNNNNALYNMYSISIKIGHTSQEVVQRYIHYTL